MTKHWSPRQPLGLSGPLERKDAEEVKMTPELKKMLDDLQRGFNQFKEKNDKEIADVKKNGVTDVVLKEHTDRINKAVGDLQERLDQAILDSKRPRLTDKDGKELSADEIAHKKAFDKFFRKGEIGNLGELEQKALSAGSNPDGGYLVPREIETAILRIITDISPVRSVAQVISIGTGSYAMPVNLTGANSGWVSEAGTRSQTNTPQLSQIVFPVHEMYAMPGATQTLLDDANINTEQWLADEVRIEFARQEGAAFVNGNGVGKPQGFMSYPKVVNSSYAWGSIGSILTGTANAFSANPDAVDDFIDVVYALKNEYRARARWAMNRATTAAVRKFRDGDNNYIWQPSIQVGQPASLLGYAVVEMEDMSSAGDGNYPVAFADWASAYLIVDRIGIRVLRDPFSAKPYVLFYTTKRVGGGIQNFEAIKLLKTDDA